MTKAVSDREFAAQYRARNARYMVALRAERKAAGLCVYCGSATAQPPYTNCKPCRVAINERKSRRRADGGPVKRKLRSAKALRADVLASRRAGTKVLADRWGTYRGYDTSRLLAYLDDHGVEAFRLHLCARISSVGGGPELRRYEAKRRRTRKLLQSK